MDKKISALDLVTTLDTGDVLPIVNQATTKKVTVAKLIDGLATTTYVNNQDALKVDKVTGKGLSTEDYTTTEKNKLAGITGINTGDQDLQSVTDKGSQTTNTITISPIGNNRGLQVEATGNETAIIGDSLGGDGIQGYSYAQRGVLAYSQIGAGLRAESISGKGIEVYGNGNGTSSVEVNLGNTNKGLVINSGASSTGNFIELDKNGVDKLVVNQAGELTATKLIKEGGTSSQFLMADGSVTTDGGSFVPYTGATSDVNLGEFGIQLGNLEFDNTPTNIPTTPGSVYYNDADGTLDLILKGGNVTLQLGQETVIRVVNKTATNISLLQGNYQAVRITGAQGQRPKVDLAQATNDVLSAETIGLVTETIADNQEGFITTSGLVRGINTTGSIQGETWLDGDILYLSPTVAGRITKVKPIAPNHLVIIGYVIHAHATQGTIFVKVDNGYELDELHNVKINGATNNEVLAYTLATDIWENKTLPEAGIQPTITLTTTGTSGASTLIGDTLNIPQYSGGGSSSQSAYTILANNTDAIALPTEQVYKNVAEQTYTGSPTWTGTAPTTILANTYKWNQVGSLVTITLSLSYNVSGSNATVLIPLPTDLPTPLSPTGFTGALDILYYGTGTFNTSTTAVAVTPRTVLLRRNSANNGYEFLLTTGTAISIKVVHLTLQYFT